MPLPYPWKATADEKRAIRAVAAASEKTSPQSIIIEVGERSALDGSNTVSTNLLAFGTEDDALDRSDLSQPLPWTELDNGIPLVEGRALVDFYVYEKLVGDHGDLLTNVQAHVDTIEGKPRLWKITGTGMRPVSGDTLGAFMRQPKHRTFGTRDFYLIEDWIKAR